MATNEVQLELQRLRGQSGSQASSPQNEVQAALAELRSKPLAKKDGFLKTLGKEILRPFGQLGTTAVNVGESVLDLARGDIRGASEALEKTRDVPFLGKTEPAFTGSETTPEAAKKMIGFGAEVASFAPIGGAAKGVGLTLKGAVGQGIKRAVPEAAIGTALALGGKELQEGGTYGEASIEALKGLGYGAVGGLVLGGATPLLTKVVPDALKFGAGKASGLSRGTIETATSRGGELAAARAGGLERATVEKKVKSAFERLKDHISDTGAAYKPIREGAEQVDIPVNYWQESLSKVGIVLDDAGQVDRKASKVMSKSDKSTIDDFLTTFAQTGQVSSGEFLRMRSGLANIGFTPLGSTKTSVSGSVSRQLRHTFNNDFRKKISGLNEIDEEYAGLIKFINETKSVVDKKGEVKLSAVVNSLKRGRKKTLATLEKLQPGIKKDLELLAAIEDIEYAAGNKVGAYAQNILFGGGVGLLAGGIPSGLIGAILANPKIIIPILERYSIGKGLIRDAVKTIIDKLRRGVKPTAAEGKIISQALKDAQGKPIPKVSSTSPKTEGAVTPKTPAAKQGLRKLKK